MLPELFGRGGGGALEDGEVEVVEHGAMDDRGVREGMAGIARDFAVADEDVVMLGSSRVEAKVS